MRTKGGKDLVCVTAPLHGRLSPKTLISMDTGIGDDRVVVSGKVRQAVVAQLGRGTDRFVGGPGDDVIETDPRSPGGNGALRDTTRDVVETGAGNDVVTSRGRDGSRDIVRLGAGNDRLELKGGAMLSDGRVDGGAGNDSLDVTAASGSKLVGDLVINNVAGRGTRNGKPWLRQAAVEAFTLDVDGSLTFTGTGAAESLNTESTLLHVDMAGGNDRVTVTLPKDTSVIVGGAGADQFLMHDVPTVDADLATGVLTSGDSVSALSGFETASVYAYTSATLAGSDLSELLTAVSCETTTITGGSGNDRLVSNEPDGCGFGGIPGPATINGGPGNDSLTGSGADDTLTGGEGQDTAFGAGGFDICDAESRASCEA
ncbi:MAG: calcium-binding protein [Beijerinckiaceae bacterium]|nr:calcium-binding protein [Beijerinckiaceae bacterium]